MGQSREHGGRVIIDLSKAHTRSTNLYWSNLMKSLILRPSQDYLGVKISLITKEAQGAVPGGDTSRHNNDVFLGGGGFGSMAEFWTLGTIWRVIPWRSRFCRPLKKLMAQGL